MFKLIIVIAVMLQQKLVSADGKHTCIVHNMDAINLPNIDWEMHFYTLITAHIHISFADACHVNSPACENTTPDFNKTFGECCSNYDPLQRQDSFGSGSGAETCIHCATLGKLISVNHH